MKEKRREPEVPVERVPAVERLDGLARITLKGTCNNSFCEKMAPSRMLVLQDQEWLSVWGKVLVCTMLKKNVIGMNEDPLPTKVTIDQGNLMREE